MKSFLENYELMSGQSVNFAKSCIVYSINTLEEEKQAIAQIFGVEQAVSIGNYLGLPMGVGRNKKEVFAYIENKMRQRIGGRKKKILSEAGKKILLKSVAQALPTYTMSLYYLPISLCETLEQLMNKFWWQSNSTSGGGVHWLSWSRLSTPKHIGGLGFKGLHQFTVALLAKQGWCLMTNPNSVAAHLFKTRY